MDRKNNYAIFIDLENTGGKASTLTSVIEKVKIRGNILLGSVYGFQESYSSLKEILLSNTFNVFPSIKYGANQKNNLDIKLVIDALEVAYTNPLIDCFCIVSGDSDYTPLVGKLKSMGKYVLGISRSAVASKIFIRACNEFIFLESVASKKSNADGDDDVEVQKDKVLLKLILKIIDDQADTDGTMFVSVLKNAILRLQPEFSEKDYGYSAFVRLLNDMSRKYNQFNIYGEQSTLKIKIINDKKAKAHPDYKNYWVDIFDSIFKEFKREGFDKVNPSIIKARLQSDYPDFSETDLGFKKFSDLLKQLEHDKKISLEFNDSKTMLVKIN